MNELQVFGQSEIDDLLTHSTSALLFSYRQGCAKWSAAANGPDRSQENAGPPFFLGSASTPILHYIAGLKWHLSHTTELSLNVQ
ncbi:hypothetical protein GWI33_007823 [Rhynchophorus ferrugineus]|uniref:Uncharacterized protein n=1 Tax=Rhynchophorus ferrugineus TaxID=354439 RepID=A0A834IFM1_RHYFE|nr:hypothetical protein GWI33_007823 [Rhynchophorus ferrugineus]